MAREMTNYPWCQRRSGGRRRRISAGQQFSDCQASSAVSE